MINMKDRIHIVLASDDAYVQHLGVLLVSIFENNREEMLVIHLLADSISNENRALISQIVEKQYRNELHFYEMDKALFQDFPLRAKDHISIASYYRLKLPDLLPKEISRILYLDCDMIVTGKLRPLWDTDIVEVSVAAVMDSLSFMPETFERLSLPEGKYFNAGMLLINLEYWRQENVFEKALQIAEERSDVLLWHDQDILNILFYNHWKQVSYRWNVMNTLMRPLSYFNQDLLQEIDNEIQHRIIIHYTCAWKPWIYPCDNPLCFEYYKYLDCSPWKGFKPKATIWKRLRWFIHRVRLSLGLLQEGYRKIKL